MFHQKLKYNKCPSHVLKAFTTLLTFNVLLQLITLLSKSTLLLIYQKLYSSKTLGHVADDEEHVGDAEADQEVVEEGRHGSGSEKIGLDGKLESWK